MYVHVTKKWISSVMCSYVLTVRCNFGQDEAKCDTQRQIQHASACLILRCIPGFRQNCAIHTYSSPRQSMSHYYWYAMKDGSKLFTRSCWGNNTFVHYNRQLIEGHKKKSRRSSPLLPYSVQRWLEWLTRVNNYWLWMLDPFLQVRKKISEHGLKTNYQENSRMSGLPGRYGFLGLLWLSEPCLVRMPQLTII